jgi:AAA domain
MNTKPQLPEKFQQVILEKSQNFVNCEFIFNTIDDFIDNHNHGYFTIVGSPGSGKSAILAKFTLSKPNVIYYNAQIENKHTAEEFLKYICQQIIERLPTTEFPDQDKPQPWLFSLLLQLISDELAQKQKLIIAIDALDAIDYSNQSPSSNLFYLPRYVPQNIYFLLTRRPFKKGKSGLLIEAPSQTIDLSEYEIKNWDNEKAFSQHWQKMQSQGLSEVELKILQQLASAPASGIDIDTIAQKISVQKYSVIKVIDSWFEFLQQHRVDKQIKYSFYRSDFADWLKASWK